MDVVITTAQVPGRKPPVLVTAAAGGVFAAGDGPTVGPWPGTALTYISAHTIENNIAIYTAPGTDPAYVAIRAERCA